MTKSSQLLPAEASLLLTVIRTREKITTINSSTTEITEAMPILFGPYESNELITQDHMWAEEGTYTIRARAKDVNDTIGDWGTLEVEMPKNKLSTFLQSLFFHRIFEIVRM